MEVPVPFLMIAMLGKPATVEDEVCGTSKKELREQRQRTKKREER
jgi:hypothetical protein